MSRTLAIGMIGDRLPEYARPQNAALEMIRRSADALGVDAEVSWIATPSLENEGSARLAAMDAIWCSPGSPYLSLDGALEGIRYARVQRIPFIGTCAGFQHTVLEYARNVVGIAGAASEEYEPDSAPLLVTRLSCPIATQTLRIELDESSRTAAAYGQRSILEYYYCNFGLNPAFVSRIDAGGLRVVGRDQNGEPRVLERPSHPFFIATLFVPGASYVEGTVKIDGPHPLVTAWMRAAAAVSTGGRPATRGESALTGRRGRATGEELE